MNLDRFEDFNKLDHEDMQAEIDGLPQQLANAYSNARQNSVGVLQKPESILVAGMGGSAIGADLLASYCAPFCSVPIISLRGYSLPNWAKEQNVLVVTSSHSGNTEETVSVFNEAQAAGLPILAVATGGEISREAKASNTTLWQFEHKGQPRAAVGFSFGILLAMLEKLDVIPDQSEIMQQTYDELLEKRESYMASVPIVKNPVKRMAGQAVGRQTAVFGADHLATVARRWKTQINELAKAWAQYEVLPEADHNTLAGTEYDDQIVEKTLALFLKGSYNHPRNTLRIDFTKKEMMLAGFAVDSISFEGKSSLTEMWDAILFGDYFSYYLALSYDVDPTPIDALLNLKQFLKNSP